MAYASVAVEGGLFPSDLLDRIATGDAEGQRPADFGLDGARRLVDEIQSAFSDARSFWDAFQRRLERSRESKTTITREDWVVPFLELLGFYQIQVQRASAEAGGEKYPISHRMGEDPSAPPVHIVALEQELDRREGARRSPHALVQDYLNRSDALWGIVTNGRRLRLLRDSARLAKPTYLEFDLEGMITGNLYSEFVLLYRLTHSSRFPRDAAAAHECLLESYYQQGIDEGGRVRDKLRDGVEEALKVLGTAFLVHPDSRTLRDRLAGGQLDAPRYYRQLLRLVYRLLFLMVSEERRLIFPPGADMTRQAVYTKYYSVTKLRDRAERYFAGDTNGDLWLGLRETFRLFRDNDAAQKLGLAALDGELFSQQACEDLEGAGCPNSALLTAIRRLSTFVDEGTGRGRRRGAGLRRRVNYAGLDVEEFGSVYESLLDYHPQITLDPPTFDLVAGSERKQTGSYYTPPELVRELIESALVPVMEERLAAAKTSEAKEQALIDLRVCDPAAGSGHFLLAAARRIARELARVRSREEEPAPKEYRRALRDVIRHCVYAVDKNPLAVDLCKVALWIEGHSEGLPLSFLDHHVKCGDSLVGVFDLKVLKEGIPDDAYKPVTGDDRTAARFYRDRNKREREGQLTMGLGAHPPDIPTDLAREFEALAAQEERTPDDVQAKEGLYEGLRAGGGGWERLKIACDLWTYAFFAPKPPVEGLPSPLVPTSGVLRDHLLTNSARKDTLRAAVGCSESHRFFHWPLEFPDVFGRGGFDVVLGNPPWDKVETKEVEFFQTRDIDIARLTGNSRKTAIAQLQHADPALWNEFEIESRRADCYAEFAKGSGRFPLTGTGRMNVFALFAESNRALTNDRGRVGLLVPTSIATDDTFKNFFADLVDKQLLVSLFDFENREGLFPGVDSRYKFCLLTVSGGPAASAEDMEFAFFLHRAEQLRLERSRFSLASSDLALLNPNTHTCPTFRSRRDAELTKHIYGRVPVLINHRSGDNPWDVVLMTDLVNMTNDSHSFSSTPGSGLVRLFEGKMTQAFDHRAASVKTVAANLTRAGQPIPTTLIEHEDPSYSTSPQYWLPRDQALHAFQRVGGKEDPGLLVYKCVTSPTNERTLIATIVPFGGVAHSMNVVYPKRSYAPSTMILLASLNSFICDYVLRQKIGGVNLSLFLLEQLPVLPPTKYEEPWPWSGDEVGRAWIMGRALELIYTAHDLQAFAHACGYGGPPFRWDEERRLLLRCELDAAFFHLYGIAREDVDYIMDTFHVRKQEDEQRFGEYRTKRVILEIYDEMAEASRSGQPYRTRLDPPPADPRVAHTIAAREAV